MIVFASTDQPISWSCSAQAAPHPPYGVSHGHGRRSQHGAVSRPS